MYTKHVGGIYKKTERPNKISIQETVDQIKMYPEDKASWGIVYKTDHACHAIYR